jgi:hypothetical protein
MTPQERELIAQLLGRLKQSGGQPKDVEADAMIRRAASEQPDAPYYLVQTVLIQDMALANAQQRIAELERQLGEARQPAQPTSFLGGLLGRTAPGAAGAGPWGRGPATAAAASPWSQPQQPGVMAGPMMGPQPWAGGGFLRQAAATAAGIAGGALLFEGIQSLFGHQAGGMLSGAAYQPGLSETVINNYYGTEPGGAPQGVETASQDTVDTGYDSSADDASADDAGDADDGSGSDYGGSDSDLA